MESFVLKEEGRAIIGAAMEVHSQLGCGFLEKVYQEALELEFTLRGIPFEREKFITINYKGHPLAQQYKADFVCFNEIIIELKAVTAVDASHRAQTVNYLKATGKKVGYLLNFGETSLKFERYVNLK